tara:strand:+ start:1098 stop:1583 length:486 start_codon:yes stop_codon:yes gene_type:complete
MDSYDIKKLKGLYALAKYMSSRTDELKDPYVEVLSIDQRKHGTSYIEDEIEPYGTYLTELPELTDSKFFKNIGSAVKYSEKLMEKDYIDDVYISVIIFLYDKVSNNNVLNMFSFTEFEYVTKFELAYIHGWDLEHPIENDYVDRKLLENVGSEVYSKKTNF